MTLAIALGIAAVFVGIFGVIAYQLWKTFKVNEQMRVVTVYVQKLAFHIEYTNGAVDGEKLKAHATKAIECLAAVWPVQQQVQLIDGLHVDVMPVKDWMDPSSTRKVAGLSFPSLRAVQVGSDLRALAHEMAHIMEAGMGRLSPAVEHEGWVEKGIFAALQVYETSFTWEGA